MKKCIILILAFPLVFYSQQKITLEDIWSKYTFSSKSPQSFNVMKDGLTYADIETSSDGVVTLCKYDLKSGKKIKRYEKSNQCCKKNQHVRQFVQQKVGKIKIKTLSSFNKITYLQT